MAALLLLIIIGFAYVSFDLYITAKKAQKDTQDYAAQLTAETARRVALSRPFVFNFFLEAWRQGRNQQAALVFRFLSEGSKEHKAAAFLISPNPVAEKEADFRQALSGENNWFAEFIIGEDYLRNGDRKKALEAYKLSNEAVGQALQSGGMGVDGFLVELLKTRLEQLSVAEEPAEKNEMQKAMN